MTKTLEVVEPRDEEPLGPAPQVLDESLLETGLSPDEVALVAGLVRRAKDQGLALTGPGGLLKSLTKTVLETALEEELSEHLGYDKHDPVGRNLGNSRNGYRSETVVTDACGEVEIAVPRDREGSFEPQIVAKRQRRLTDLDQLVISLFSKGLTTGEISAHLMEVYGASVSKDTVSRITDKIVEEMTAWWSRPLEKVYAAVFIDAIAGLGRWRAGRQPALLRRDRGRPGRPQRHPRDLARVRRWGISKVLAGRAHRPEEPRRRRRLLPGLRRPEGPARQCHRGVPPDHGPDLHHPPDPQHVPLRVPQVLGTDQPGPETDLYRPHDRRGRDRPRRLPRQLGTGLPRDPDLVDERLDRVRPVPRLRPRDPPGPLLDERDRITERPVPARRPSPRPLPDRTSRAENPLPGRPIP